MPREETEGEPSVDKHGHKLQNINVPLARWQGFEPRWLGGENRPAEGREDRGRQAPLERRGQAPAAETFVRRVGEAGHVRRARDKQADWTTPESVGGLAGQELANKGHVACDMRRDAEAAAAAPRRRGAGRRCSACRETGHEGSQAGVLPLLDANGEVGTQRLNGRSGAQVAEDDGADGD